MLYKKFYLGVYKCTLYFIKGNASKATKFLKEDKVPNADELKISDDSEASTYLNGGYIIIHSNRKISKPVLYHEILHATIHILTRAGIPLTDSSEESYTYLLEYIGRIYDEYAYKTYK